ncbi:MAG: zinc-dependent alcohol dehydrogenase family protein [Vicinamibacteria bacterium]
MKALVYRRPGKRQVEDQPRPQIASVTDAIVRVTTTTICGTDLHILKGDVPEVTDGRILGHEGVGIIEDLGSAVTTFAKGDKVLISCITACGTCDFCQRGMRSHCRSGGWLLGHTIDGTQAEYVRIPHASTSLYKLPAGVNEEAAVLLSDIFPTGFECGVLNGRVKPGDVVAIVGAGPIGLAALITAQFYSPSRIMMIDRDLNRLDCARRLGATDVFDASRENLVEEIMALTAHEGADVVIEAVGTRATFEMCQALVAPGGTIANVGVHGTPVELKLERLWAHNITMTTGLVDTVTTPLLLKFLASGRLRADALITHRFGLSECVSAYETFSDAIHQRALKVILRNDVSAPA